MVKDVLNEITRLRLARNWSEYELAARSGRKKQMPTILSLDKVCQGCGITLAQFFAEGDSCIPLTEEQLRLLDLWASLTPKQQSLFLQLFETYK